MRYVEELQWIFHFIRRMFKIHITHVTGERIEYFRWFAFISETMFKTMTMVYVSSVFMFIPYPLYKYYTKHEFVPMMDLYLPGIDETTYTGYMILTTFHLSIFVFGTLGVSSSDFCHAIMILSPLINSKLISLDLHQINVDLKEKQPMTLIKSRFRNTLLMHQELDEYVVYVLNFK